MVPYPTMRDPTYKLYCGCHQMEYQPAIPHQMVRDSDLPSALWMPPRDISASDLAYYDERSKLTAYIVDRRHMYQPASNPIVRDLDLHPMLKMPPKAASASNLSSSHKRSRLATYVMDATKICISQQPSIQSSEIWTYRLYCGSHGNMY